MTEVVQIDVEPASDEAFAPFGRLIGLGQGENDAVFANPGLRSWRVDYDCADQTEVMFIWFDHVPMTFSKIERHFAVTQTFIPHDRAEMIMVVAPATDPSDWNDLPPALSLRAFRIPGTHGVMMWKGVWHTLNRYPIDPPGGGFTLLTSRATQAELEREKRDGTLPKLTQTVDCNERLNVSFAVRL